MASSWLSRRPHCRRLGGRGHCWRRASAKGILQLRVPTRRLCRPVMLRLARTDLGRMALGHSPRGGMLLTKAAFNGNVGKEDLASWDARLRARELDWQDASARSAPDHRRKRCK